jgi:hypothetical protein
MFSELAAKRGLDPREHWAGILAPYERVLS